MNNHQKANESNCRTTMLLKIYQRKLHQSTLEKIENRKCEQTTFSPKLFPNRPRRLNPINIYKKIKEDIIHSNRLSEIIFKKASPQLNDSFIKFDQKKQVIAFKRRKDTTQQIEKENCELFERINKAQPFISPRNLDLMYKYHHIQLIKKMSKFSYKTYEILEKSLSHPKITFNRNKYHHKDNTLTNL